MPGQRLLLASIHDVSPRFEREVDALVDLLAAHVGGRMAMLVVPNHWGDAPIVPGTAFARRLRSWADQGIEMFLHGFYHRDEARHPAPADRLRARLMTAGEGEFLGLDAAEATARIAEGRRLLEDMIARPLAGFVAPAWLYGAGTIRALEDAQLPIAEDHFSVWSPSHRRLLARGPAITWASRSRTRLGTSLATASVLRRAPMRVLRVGVHPPDVRHASLVRSIGTTLAVACRTRRPGAYAELIRT